MLPAEAFFEGTEQIKIRPECGESHRLRANCLYPFFRQCYSIAMLPESGVIIKLNS